LSKPILYFVSGLIGIVVNYSVIFDLAQIKK